MKISVLCSSASHPVYPYLESWVNAASAAHSVELVQTKAELSGGDILFLISCHEIISRQDRARYGATLVIHSSDLPEGRGWSPQNWQILEGRNKLVVSLLEADDKVDSGAIWAKRPVVLEGHELCDEINHRLFSVWVELMDHAVANFGRVEPQPQDDRQPSYYRRRTSEDSRLDPAQSISAQFDLLRVADPDRFPAFFDFRGHRYHVRISKASEVSDE
ncbi:UDP-glucuronic acid dehydrogenase [Bradyrhizobium diazoefficiens]|nr:UDP-glucuronic acid dehydrogenase [Bradyrhizobium diazoefficiens]